jgi:NAD-dependent dihydropyrimidine dehydrogenase PreA subunit
MIREIVTIDEALCNGCGDCVPACHEGALQIIDGKVRLVSDLMCDGLGACIGHCPQGAIAIEKREAEPYDEAKVMSVMIQKGKNTVVAHLRHLKEHNEREYLKQGVQFLNENAEKISFKVEEVLNEVHTSGTHQHGGGCPGSKAMSFEPKSAVIDTDTNISGRSELRQWPVQMHLINPQAGYFQHSDVVLAADCVAFSLGNFHQQYLKGKSLAIACPKLDGGQEVYIGKIKSLIDDAQINTLHVMIMQVPCCAGLLQMAQIAASQSARKVPIKVSVVGIEGDILSEKWV